MPRVKSDFSSRSPLTLLGGLAISSLAFYLLLSLVTYTQADPSLNRATGNAVSNAGGYFGALLADMTLQTLGLASAFLILVPMVWGVKLLFGRPASYLWLRLVTLLCALVLVAGALSTTEPPLSWPITSGLGGAIGMVLHDNLYRLFKNHWFILATDIVAAFMLTLALGMRWSEWQTIGRVIKQGALIVSALALSLKNGKKAPKLKLVRNKINEEDEEEDEKPDRRQPRISKKEKTVEKARATQPKIQVALALAQGDYALPSLDLLNTGPRAKKSGLSEAALTQNAKLLESVLQEFGVNGTIGEIRPGPVVTLYELEPSPGTKSSRVIGLCDDIARSMSAVSARIAVIPGRNVIGIELPNTTRETVFLREMLESEAFGSVDARLPLALGKDIGGAPIIVDLARMPHLLVAGTTGSGKSVAVNTMIASLVYKLTPAECKFIMIDPKMLELSIYDGIPHLLTPVVTEPAKAIVALKWTVKEMENRYRLMSNLSVRNIDGYNKKIREAKAKGHQLTRTVQTGFNPDTGEAIIEEMPLEMVELPFIVVVVDEMADLMIIAGKEIEGSIQRLAQMARAAGIHIIMATQRPSVDVITGVIKANFPTRISFQVTSRIDSRTILNEPGAEQLLGAGDMLYMAGGGRITRVHGPFVSDKEVEQVVKHLKAQGAPVYIDDVTKDEESESPFEAGEGGDALYQQAVEIVMRDKKASTSYIQRHLRIGYNKAATIIEQMERQGIVGPANHVGKREVIGA
jgi:DNA segregation ATPase FtsK/SpoIIIE, S-DNA-T family